MIVLFTSGQLFFFSAGFYHYFENNIQERLIKLPAVILTPADNMLFLLPFPAFFAYASLTGNSTKSCIAGDMLSFPGIHSSINFQKPAAYTLPFSSGLPRHAIFGCIRIEHSKPG